MFQINLVEVPNNIWWLEYDATTYVSIRLQGFTTIQTINSNKKFMFMGNSIKVKIEG